jgi:hypothetical protein
LSLRDIFDSFIPASYLPYFGYVKNLLNTALLTNEFPLLENDFENVLPMDF